MCSLPAAEKYSRTDLYTLDPKQPPRYCQDEQRDSATGSGYQWMLESDVQMCEERQESSADFGTGKIFALYSLCYVGRYLIGIVKWMVNPDEGDAAVDATREMHKAQVEIIRADFRTRSRRSRRCCYYFYFLLRDMLRKQRKRKCGSSSGVEIGKRKARR